MYEISIQMTLAGESKLDSCAWVLLLLKLEEFVLGLSGMKVEQKQHFFLIWQREGKSALDAPRRRNLQLRGGERKEKSV